MRITGFIARICMTVFAVGAIGVAAQIGDPPISGAAAQPADLSSGLISHVVVIYQENHTFDETLGDYCASRDTPCDGYVGPVYLKDGRVARMTPSPDIVPVVDHRTPAQVRAIDGGQMDGWASIGGCGGPGFRCLTYYTPQQIPTLATLADHFVVADRTFTMADSASWGGHLYAAAATLDGFTGDQPSRVSGVTAGPGWGCDSNNAAKWTNASGITTRQPACIPNSDGTGAFRPTPVAHVSTIFDSLESAGRSWKVYGAPVPQTVGGQSQGYGWSICPSFADCLYTAQADRLVPSADILSDAANGALPNYSVLTPSWSSTGANGGLDTSQHNTHSMMAGDNWIASVVSAIEGGPDWSSTAIFITYDDCGCFYDHVAPPINPDGTQQGPRTPMVIVSPYAIAGSTDSNNATFASILAFTEHVFGIPALAANDAAAYDYANSFDFSQRRLPAIALRQHPVPPASIAYLKSHPDAEDDDVT